MHGGASHSVGPRAITTACKSIIKIIRALSV